MSAPPAEAATARQPLDFQGAQAALLRAGDRHLEALADAGAPLTDLEEDLRLRLALLTVMQRPAPLLDRLRDALRAIVTFPPFAGLSRAGIFRADCATRTLKLVAIHGNFPPEFLCLAQTVPFGECLCGRAVLSGDVLHSWNSRADVRHERGCAALPSHGHFIVPLMSDMQPQGVLFLYTAPDPPWGLERLMLLREVGQILGAAMALDASTYDRGARACAMQFSLRINDQLQALLGNVELLLESRRRSGPATPLRAIRTAAERLARLVDEAHAAPPARA